MVKNRNRSKKEKNNIKLDVFPNLYSIVALWASVLILFAEKLIQNEKTERLVILVLFLSSFIMHYFIERAFNKRIEAGKKVELLKNKISKHARLAGYWGYVVLALTAFLA